MGTRMHPGPSSKSRGFPGLPSGHWGLGADLPAGRTSPRPSLRGQSPSRPKASFLMRL